MTLRSEFGVALVNPEMVYIYDLDRGAMSVTNDAERVVEYLYKNYGNRRFIYRDSMGEWSELLHENGTFTDFGLPLEGIPL